MVCKLSSDGTIFNARWPLPHTTKHSMTWKAMMTWSNENISALLALCEGNSPVTCGFHSQRHSLWRHCTGIDVCPWRIFNVSLVSVYAGTRDIFWNLIIHNNDVIMTTMASQITTLTLVYSTVYSDADRRKHPSSASLAFVWGIHRSRWIPRTKGQLRRKCFHLMTSSCPGGRNPRCHCLSFSYLM